MKPKAFDTINWCREWEDGKLNEDQTVELFQRMIDAGTVWKLGGIYSQTAKSLIGSGVCVSGNLSFNTVSPEG